MEPPNGRPRFTPAAWTRDGPGPSAPAHPGGMCCARTECRTTHPAHKTNRYMNNDEMKQLIQRGFATLGVRTSVMAGVPTSRATPRPRRPDPEARTPD